MIHSMSSLFRRHCSALAAAATLVTGVAAPAFAHISYSGRNFGTITTTGSTITNQAVSSSFGWADATDADWGDTHRTRVYRFTLSSTTSVAITAQRQNLVTGTASGQQTGNHDTLLPAFSVFQGLSHTSSPLAHDHSSLSVEWLITTFGTSAGTGLGGSGKEGSLNALGAWSIGNSLTDYPAPSSGSDSLRSFTFVGYAADGSSTNFGATPGLVGDGNADGFVTTTLWNLAPGDYSIFVGGANYAAQNTETETFGANGNAFPTYGLTVTVAPVPEPSTAALALIGSAGIYWITRGRLRDQRNQPETCEA